MDEDSLTHTRIFLSLKRLNVLNRDIAILLVLLLVGIVVGLFLADDYGLSWDEYYNETYARQTIEMYLGKRTPGDAIIDKEYYGPSFLVAWVLAKDLLLKIFPSLHTADAGHIIYWLAFLPAPLLVYGLSRRFAGRTASLAGALLFASQPVIFGHAFVNPKDPPFMTAFLASMWLGLLAVDLSAQKEKWLSLYSIPSEAKRVLRKGAAAWRESTALTKIALCFLWGAFILVTLDLLATHLMMHWLFQLLQRAYEGQAVGPVQAIFNAVAQDSIKTPLTTYIDKAQLFYLWIRFPLLAIGLASVIFFSIHMLDMRITKRWFSQTRTWWAWGFAAIALGLCSTIRVFGPFAGAMVAWYAVTRLKGKSWLPILLYGFISFLILYAAWPTLWGAPFQSLIDSILLMGKHPWGGRFLYNGYVYAASETPWHYVPVSIGIKLTLPALALSALGIVLALAASKEEKHKTVYVFLLLVWMALPLAVVVLTHANIYSAFRQLMFVLPPMFILGSFGLEKILGFSRSPAWSILVIGLVLAPGLFGIYRLHPYEFIYHNELVGGVAGAAGRYGLGSWGTEYREAVEYLNGVAPNGSRVLVGPREFHMMTPFARDDLQFGTLSSDAIRSSTSQTFLINGGAIGESFHAESLYVIEREGVSLVIVQVLP